MVNGWSFIHDSSEIWKPTLPNHVVTVLTPPHFFKDSQAEAWYFEKLSFLILLLTLNIYLWHISIKSKCFDLQNQFWPILVKIGLHRWPWIFNELENFTQYKVLGFSNLDESDDLIVFSACKFFKALSGFVFEMLYFRSLRHFLKTEFSFKNT